MEIIKPEKSWLIDMSIISGDIANYCDKVEHVEDSIKEREIAIEAGISLRGLAMEIAERQSRDIFDLYADRIDFIESLRHLPYKLHPHYKEHAEKAKTWRDLQTVQINHDRDYFMDVFGNSKKDQVRHHSFHMTKINKALAIDTRAGQLSETFIKNKIPDMLIFGLALSTAFGQKLEDIPLPRRNKN